MGRSITHLDEEFSINSSHCITPVAWSSLSDLSRAQDYCLYADSCWTKPGNFFGIPWLAGWGQPIADAVKAIMKEIIIPSGANKFLFVLAPVLTIAPALAAWAVVPFSPEIVLADINAGLLYILAMTSMGVYGIIIAGWASNSKYAF